MKTYITGQFRRLQKRLYLKKKWGITTFKTEAIHTARLITKHALLLATGKSAQGRPHVIFRDT